MVGEKGVIGIMSVREALAMAREQQLDLVEVAPNADPPVCRMMDYGKFLYEKAKRERKARKASKTIEVKGVRLTTRTGEHDLEFKSRDARRFLEEGCKVKVRVWFKGREITYPELGQELLEKFAARLADIATVETPPKIEGHNMTMLLAPVAKK